MDVEVKAWQAYVGYFKELTGIDLNNPDIEGVDSGRITVSVPWQDACLRKAVAGLSREEEVVFLLLDLAWSPRIKESQTENVKIGENSIIWKEK